MQLKNSNIKLDKEVKIRRVVMKAKKKIRHRTKKINAIQDQDPTGRLNKSEAKLHEEKVIRGHFYGKRWLPDKS